MAYLGKTPSQAVRSRYYFTASGSETSLSPSEVTGLSFTDANYVDVSLNGVALVSGTDYTATPSTNTISSLAALTASDVVEIVVYDTFSVFGGNVNGDFNISGGDLTLGDNDALIFGDGSDFKISHNGSKTKLEDTGTGNLEIRGTNIEFYSGDGGETLAKLTDDGAAELYHNNTKRIETSATGVDITGGFTASDGCTITTADNSQQLSLISTDADANVGPELHLRRNSASPANNDAAGEISFNANNDAGQNTNIVSVDTKILNVADGTEEGGLELRTMKAGSMRSRINMYGSTTVINDDSQDIDFRVESDGDANAFFVEGSSGNVGIGTSSPAATLTVSHASGTDGRGIRLVNSSNNQAYETRIGVEGVENTSYVIKDMTADAPRFLIDTSGNVKIGSANLLSGGSAYTNEGISLQSGSDTVFHRNGGSVVDFSRQTSHGQIIRFVKDNSVIGTLGSESNADFVIDGAGNHAGIRFVSDSLTPRYAGNDYDNGIDLGKSDARFDDVFATNGTIQTSDQNEKQDIASLTTAEMTAAKAISKLFKTFKWKSKVAAKGDAARTHTGVIAQEVQTAMSDAGLDASNYAFWCSDTWWETSTEVAAVEAVEEVRDKDGNLTSPPVEAQDAYTRIDTYQTADEAPEGATQRTRLGIRYPELLAFVGAATEQRLGDIETRLTALENAE